jgi:hypothetical protein
MDAQTTMDTIEALDATKQEDTDRKLYDTKEDLDATKQSVSSIQKAIEDAVQKRAERERLKAHPEEWPQYRFVFTTQ